MKTKSTALAPLDTKAVFQQLRLTRLSGIVRECWPRPMLVQYRVMPSKAYEKTSVTRIAASSHQNANETMTPRDHKRSTTATVENTIEAIQQATSPGALSSGNRRTRVGDGASAGDENRQVFTAPQYPISRPNVPPNATNDQSGQIP